VNLLDVVILGILVGWLRKGRIGNLGYIPLRGVMGFIALGALDLLMQLTQSPERRLLYQVLIMGSAGAAFLLLWLNHRLPGVRLVLSGLVLNLVVMGANGGRMPVSTWAANVSGQAEFLPLLTSGESSRHVPLGPQTHMGFLSDLIPIPPPYPAARVLSIGDLLVFAGIIWLVAWGMQTRSAESSQRN